MAEDRVRIRVEADGLTARVTVCPGSESEEMRLADALAAAAVEHGIDARVVEEITASLEDPG